MQYVFSKQLKDSSVITATGGVRANFWDYNKQTVVSPRLTLSYKPYCYLTINYNYKEEWEWIINDCKNSSMTNNPDGLINLNYIDRND